MPLCFHRCLFLLMLGFLLSGATGASAQQYNFNQGFRASAPAVASGAELSEQPNLFVMEVQFRPMGLVKVELTDPNTGKKQEKLVWYQVYRTLNRQLDTPVDDTDTLPVNPRDPIPRPYFIPEFFLLVDGKDDQNKIYEDRVIPEAVAAIEQREKLKLKNSVEIIQRLPEPVAPDAENPEWIYGVATWTDVDPNTDFFRVFAEGFSNGYQIADIAGEKVVLRKTIDTKFWRPGDKYDETDDEIRPNPQDPKPHWIYRPSGLGPVATAAAGAQE